MMTAGYKVRVNKIPKTLRQSARKLDAGVSVLAFETEAYIKRNFSFGVSAPGDTPGVDTGKLRNGIAARKRQLGHWVVSTGDTEYAVYLEFGTERMAARPFMGPAAWWLTQNYVQMLKDSVRLVE